MHLSIERALDIMRDAPKPDHKDYLRIISTQQSVAASVFSITARVNDAKLRQQANDKMGALLDMLRQEEAKRMGDVFDAEPLPAVFN